MADLYLLAGITHQALDADAECDVLLDPGRAEGKAPISLKGTEFP
jgi:hypothetical protein